MAETKYRYAYRIKIPVCRYTTNRYAALMGTSGKFCDLSPRNLQANYYPLVRVKVLLAEWRKSLEIATGNIYFGLFITASISLVLAEVVGGDRILNKHNDPFSKSPFKCHQINQAGSAYN